MLTKLALGVMGQLRPKPAQGDASPRIALPEPDRSGELPLMPDWIAQRFMPVSTAPLAVALVL